MHPKPPNPTRGVRVCERLRHALDGLRLEPRHLHGGASGGCDSHLPRKHMPTPAHSTQRRRAQRAATLVLQPLLACSLGSSGSTAGSDRRAKKVRMAAATASSPRPGSPAGGRPASCAAARRAATSPSPHLARVRSTSAANTAATWPSRASLQLRSGEEEGAAAAAAWVQQ
jgi:hypothetical protein